MSDRRATVEIFLLSSINCPYSSPFTDILSCEVVGLYGLDGLGGREGEGRGREEDTNVVMNELGADLGGAHLGRANMYRLSEGAH